MKHLWILIFLFSQSAWSTSNIVNVDHSLGAYASIFKVDKDGKQIPFLFYYRCYNPVSMATKTLVVANAPMDHLKLCKSLNLKNYPPMVYNCLNKFSKIPYSVVSYQPKKTACENWISTFEYNYDLYLEGIDGFLPLNT